MAEGLARSCGRRAFASCLVVLATGPARLKASPPQRCAPLQLFRAFPAAEPQQRPPSSCARPAGRSLASSSSCPTQVGTSAALPPPPSPIGRTRRRSSAPCLLRANPRAVGPGRAVEGVSCHPRFPNRETEARSGRRPTKVTPEAEGARLQPAAWTAARTGNC